MRYKDVFGYLRISQDDDDKTDESNSIKNQKLLIEQFIISCEEFQGAKVHFYIDDGYSGTNFERPDFKKMMQIVKGRNGCCIIVKDLSRLGRDTIDTQDYIEKIFPFLQIRFIAINDYYDSADSLSSRKDTEVKFKNLVNGIYPQICSKNIKKVMYQLGEQGKYNGPIPPYGYMFNGNDKTSLLLDREVSWVVRLVIDKRLEGESYSGIARMLNERGLQTPAQYLISKGYAALIPNTPMWTGDLIKKILINPIYTGAMVNHKSKNTVVSVKSPVCIPRKDWVIVPNMHEAIMTKAEMDTILSMRVIYNTKSEQPNRNIFRGKIRCGYCNMCMKARMNVENKRIYCKTPGRISDTKCYKESYLLENLKDLLIKLIRQQALIADDTIRKMKALNKTLNIPRMKKQDAGYEEKIRQSKFEKMELYEQYASGALSKNAYIREKEKIVSKISKYLQKRGEWNKKILEAEEKKKKIEDSQLIKFSKYAQLEDLTFEIVQELVSMIYFFDPDHIEVVWNWDDEFIKSVVEE